MHRLKQLKLHGKMLLADESRAVIGSINLAPGSFDERRELAIETDAPEVIARLKEVTRHDWDNSSMLDLSDSAIHETPDAAEVQARLAPFANSEAIASRISGAELHAYDGGHAFFIQDPQAFPDVIAFLAG